MRKYIYEIKTLLEEKKNIVSDEITEQFISDYISLDNKLSKALSKGHLSEDELAELELQLHRQKEILIQYLLSCHFGYTIMEIDGYNQWYREAKLIESIGDSSL